MEMKSGGGSTPWEELCNAIVLQAVEDYRKALQGKRVDGKESRFVVDECERFFHSDWYKALAPNIAPDVVIRTVKVQAKYEMWKEKHKCKKCKNKDCIHKQNSWTATPYVCIKS